MTQLTTWLDGLPSLAIGVGLLLIFVVSSEIGYAAHRRFGGDGGGASDETQVLSTALLLLALLLGFTFSVALARHDNRRTEIIGEANSIGTAWLLAGLVETSAGSALQARLEVYAKARIARSDVYYDGGVGSAANTALRAKGPALRSEIWELTRAATAPARTTAQATALIAAVSAVLDAATTREAAADARVPQQVMLLLAFFAAVCAFLMGYVLAAYGTRHRLATAILYGLLALIVMTIFDLDRPQNGAIRVSQQPMMDLVATMAASKTP